MKTVLVVDDKELMRDSVSGTLGRAGFSVACAESGESALTMIARHRPDAVVTDLKMPGISGIELLGGIRQVDDELPVIVMTAFGTIETAVEAMRRGAFDYITKPFEGDELVIAVKRAVTHGGLARENAVLKRSAGVPEGGSASVRGLERLVGVSGAMRRVREQLQVVASSQRPVLITGESGVGKEVVARAIHELSGRSGGPFLGVNCAALSESLLESELFGHERGAFTGAEKLRKGRFELADGGTLLLDEVSEVSLGVQAKLLRVLQESAFERVGSSVTMGVDVRVVATSNRDLMRFVGDGGFREDLYYRLNVLPVEVPALRERREDIALLAEHFIEGISRREGSEVPRVERGAMELLSRYDWPGNVRELQNVCERAVVLARAGKGERAITQELIEPWLFARSSGRVAVGAAVNGSVNGSGGPAGGVVSGPVSGPASGIANAPVNGMVNGRVAGGSMVEAKPGDERTRAALMEAVRQEATRAVFDANGSSRPRAQPLPRAGDSGAANGYGQAGPGHHGAGNGHGNGNGNGHGLGHGHGHGAGNGNGYGAGLNGAGLNGHGTTGFGSEAMVSYGPVSSATLPGDRTLDEIERETIVATLKRFGGHRQKTARALGIGVRTLGLKLKKWKEEKLVPQSL